MPMKFDGYCYDFINALFYLGFLHVRFCFRYLVCGSGKTAEVDVKFDKVS